MPENLAEKNSKDRPPLPSAPGRRKNLNAKLVAIWAVVAFVALILLGEIGLRLFGTSFVEFADTVPPSGREIREPTTRLLLPNLTVAASAKVGGKVVYDVLYHTDQFGRRLAYARPAASPKPYHLMLFGGSQVFGLGLNDDETIAYHLGKALPQFEAFSYGVAGGSMSNMLAILATRPLAEQVLQPEGALVYLLVPRSDVKRAAGPRSHLLGGFKNPHYRLVAEKPVLAGSFTQSYPWLKTWVGLVNNTRLAPRLAPFFERGVKHQDERLARAIILDAKQRYLTLFPRGKFLVATTDPTSNLVKILEKDGVELIPLPALNSPSFFNPQLGHLSSKGSAHVAENLGKELRAHFTSGNAAR